MRWIEFLVHLAGELLLGLAFGFLWLGIPWVLHKRRIRRKNREALARGTARFSEADEDATLQTIRCTDPEFSAEGLEARIVEMFHRIEEGRRAGFWDVARTCLSDGALAEVAVRPGFRDDAPSPGGLHSLRLVDARSDGEFDFVRVQLVTQSGALRFGWGRVGERRVVSRVDPERGLGSVGERTWTLMRRRGARTEPDAAAGGNCTSCGASIEDDSRGTCHRCGRFLRASTRDWLVVAVKNYRWPPIDPTHVPGIRELCRRDPSFHPFVLEDRARWLFWKMVLAARAQRPEWLGAGFHSEWRDRWIERRRMEPEARPRGDRTGIAAVDCLGVPERGPDDDWDRALVRVRWVEHESADLETLLVLGRNAFFDTDVDRLLSAAHCRSCGAPELPGAEHGCTYCGELMVTDWTWLEDVPLDGREGQAWLARLPEIPPDRSSEEGSSYGS